MIKKQSVFVGHLTAILFFLLIPLLSHAWSPGQRIIPCGYDTDGDGVVETTTEQCHFKDVVVLAGNIIDVLLYAATLLAAISFTYAGFLYVTNNGNSGRISQATSIFGKVAMGYAIALGAWLIIKMIETALLGPNAPSFLK